MMSCWPVLSVNLGASSREIVSLPPPGGYGTMRRTGFVGKSAASADAVDKTSAPSTIFIWLFTIVPIVNPRSSILNPALSQP